jgi:hypothetical protein
MIDILGWDEGKSSDSSKITMTIPNTDTYMGAHTICPKEVLQKGYIDMIGKDINFCGVNGKVSGVRITEDYIFVDLEGSAGIKEVFDPILKNEIKMFSIERR